MGLLSDNYCCTIDSVSLVQNSCLITEKAWKS